MCNTLTTIQKSCENNVGSAHNIYFLKLDDLLSYTASTTANTITALSVATDFVEIKCPPNTITYNVEYSVDDFDVEEYTHSVSFTIARRQARTAFLLKDYLQANPDLVVVIKDAMGRYIMLGKDNGMNFNSASGGAGAQKSQAPTYQMQIQGLEKEFEYEVDADVFEALI